VIVTSHWCASTERGRKEPIEVEAGPSLFLDREGVFVSLTGRRGNRFVAHLDMNDARALRDELDAAILRTAKAMQTKAAKTYVVK